VSPQPRQRARPAARYYCQTLPGLEGIAAEEIAAALPGARLEDSRPGAVYFAWRGHPAALLRLGTAEDVFALVARGDVELGRGGLAQAEALVSAAPGLIDGVNALRLVRPHKVRQVTFRVVVQRLAGRHEYVRQELGRRVGQAVARRCSRWKRVEEDATLELWVLQRGADTTIGVRLSDRTMRHRTYRRANLPGALRPVLARAMVLRSQPAADDVFLDPMCGTGTILIERGEHSRYHYLLGGDVSPQALTAARANIGRRYRPIGLQRWDATRLPLGAGSVSRIVCNLPFGRRFGAVESLPEFHRRFLGEARRVLRAGGLLVLLSGQVHSLPRLLEGQEGLVLRRVEPVLVLGQRAAILTAAAAA